MKQFSVLAIFGIIFLLASCASPETATPLPLRTLTPTPAAVNADSQSVTTIAPTQAATRLIPTIATAGNLPPARLVLEPAAPAEPADAVPKQYDLVLYDAQRIFGVQIHLSFDPSVIKVEDNDLSLPGIQIMPGEAFPRGSSFVAKNVVDTGLGSIEFAATRLSPAEPLSGRIIVASLMLVAEGSTPTEIIFDQVLLSDEAANSLPVVPENHTFRAES